MYWNVYYGVMVAFTITADGKIFMCRRYVYARSSESEMKAFIDFFRPV